VVGRRIVLRRAYDEKGRLIFVVHAPPLRSIRASPFYYRPERKPSRI
jgi:hypothetical protein